MLVALCWLLVLAIPLAFRPLPGRTNRREDALRHRIHQLVLKHPGLRQAQLARAAEVAPATIFRHLNHLAKDGLVERLPDAHASRWIPGSAIDAETGVSRRHPFPELVFRKAVTRMARTIADSPGITQQDLAQTTGLSRRTLRISLGQLHDAGLIEVQLDWRWRRYRPTPQLEAALEQTASAGDHRPKAGGDLTGAGP